VSSLQINVLLTIRPRIHITLLGNSAPIGGIGELRPRLIRSGTPVILPNMPRAILPLLILILTLCASRPHGDQEAATYQQEIVKGIELRLLKIWTNDPPNSAQISVSLINKSSVPIRASQFLLWTVLKSEKGRFLLLATIYSGFRSTTY
jgi:hypothetical protein